MPSQIVVATDGSEASDHMIEWVKGLRRVGSAGLKPVRYEIIRANATVRSESPSSVPEALRNRTPPGSRGRTGQ
jgi:hypothetical protein